jgi:hypothetical protein
VAVKIDPKVATEPRRRVYYPWEKWTDGSLWSAQKGVDFFMSETNFQTTLHIHARNHRHLGLRVKTASPEKGIVEFRFYKEGETSEVPVGPPS